MADIKKVLEIEGKKYPMAFTLNVMESIQDEYGTIDKWGDLTEGKDGEPNIKALVFGLTEMINEGLDIEAEEKGKDYKPLTHKQVARLLTKVGLAEATKQLNEVVVESTKSDEKNA
jgi:hypothetical protein|nr:MAG TPA: tail tube protein [Caudoviricetes sp.]